MGTTSIKGSCFYCFKRKNIFSKELFLESQYTKLPSTKLIILIQSTIRGYLIRKDFYNYKQVKEVSIDYSTKNFESNPMIIHLNKLHPKFELTDKEEYEINNSSNKIIAILSPNKSIYKDIQRNDKLTRVKRRFRQILFI